MGGRLIKIAGTVSKYRAQRTTLDGITFASKAEATRYAELSLMQKAGVIFDLQVQPRFPLLVDGHNVGQYIADFRYRDASTGMSRVEDVKSPSTRTAVYRLKLKLVKALYGVDVVEIM